MKRHRRFYRTASPSLSAPYVVPPGPSFTDQGEARRSQASSGSSPGQVWSVLALLGEIDTMMTKGVLEIVSDPDPGFYSRLFLVEKSSGGWRPVIDLSPLNELVQQTPSRMETPNSVLLTVRKNDFLASIDLKDAYFQIPVHPSSRKLLRFISNDTVYQFKALCFGMSTAPQVFTRVFAAVSSWAHARGIHLLQYLDDWLILSTSQLKTRQHVDQLLSLCRSLGIVINTEKSDLFPSRSVEYLGMIIDTVSARAFPTEARIQKFLSLARKFLAQPSPPARRWQVLLDTCHRWRSWYPARGSGCAPSSGI